MPPGGSYNPAITLESILLSIQLLLASPNPDDPLRDDVSDEYRYNRELFDKNAKKYSGPASTEIGHCSKKPKTTDNNDIPNVRDNSSITPIEEDGGDDDNENDENDNDNENENASNGVIDDDNDAIDDDQQLPNTSSNESAADQPLSVNSKPNRKRKHDET